MVHFMPKIILLGAAATMLSEAIGEASPVTLGVAFALAIGVWRAASVLQRMQDEIREMKNDIKDLKDEGRRNRKRAD